MTHDTELEKAARQALEALESLKGFHICSGISCEGVITALRRALEQPAQQCRTDGRCQYAIDSGAEGMGHCPEGKCVMPVPVDVAALGIPHGMNLEQPAQQEPFAWADLNALTEQFNSVNCGTAYRLPSEGRQPLYTRPQAREPLTDEVIAALWSWSQSAQAESIANTQQHAFARAIEAKLREKNA